MTKIVIQVQGGVVCGIFSNKEDVAVDIFDVDNLKEQGVDDDKQTEIWERLMNETGYCIM